jgi:penicillin-binding protein 1A
MQIVGPRTVVEYAKKMGIQTPLEIVHALALGATDLQTLEMASAYATFANKGIWMEPHFITRIEDRKGNVLFQHTPNSREALSEETSYLMIDMLRAVINSGTGASLRYKFGLDYTVDIGGKTGTTNSHADGWFVGFTPKYCTAVWVGHADRQVRFRTLEYGQGARMALPIWGYYMAQAYKDESLGSTREQFKAPAKLRVQTDCKLFRQMNPDKVCADSSASNSSYSKWGDEF